MPDSSVLAPPNDTNPADLVEVLLTISLTGVILFRPVYETGGATIVDLAYERLNPTAQHMLRLPECPSETFLTLFPMAAQQEGVFAFYRDTFLAGQIGRHQFNYQYDGLDGYFQLVAQRQGPRLVVSFTDGNDQSRTAVEQALRLSQAREQAARTEAERQRGELERLFEQAPVAIAVYRGPNYVIELANPTVCRLWGRTPEQLLGKGLFEALPEVAGMGYEQLLDGVMATGEPHVSRGMEAVHEREGRRDTVYWDFVYVPMYNNAGLIDGAMVVATEVTAQVLARQQVEQLNQELEVRVAERTSQLTAQQHLLSQILAQVPAAIATLAGPEHRFTFFNELYQNMVADRAILGHPANEVLPEVAEQGFIDLLNQVYATGQPFIGTEILIMLHDQATGKAEPRYVDFIYQPLQDGQQRTQGVLAFVLDVTDRVRARKQAETLQAAMLAVVQRQAQQRQDIYQIFAQTPAAIVLLREPDHRIDYYNPAFEALFPPEEWTGPLNGHSLGEVYPRLKLAGLVRLLDRVFETGEPQVVIDMALAELQPGSPRYVTFAYQAYREEGRIVGVAAFVYDVTEQVLVRQQVQALNGNLAAINEELYDTNARLTRTNTDLDTFVYTASHDLKAPIANIEGLLLALRQQLPPEALQADLVPRLFELMEGSVARFQQTIGYLTDISQLQRADAPETTDLPALIDAVRLDLAPLLETTPVTLTVVMDGCQAVRVAPKTLRSVVYNLLSNAVKYRAPDRLAQVQLRAHCTPGRLVLAVQDNGLGLSNAQQGELFGMFRRLHTHVEGSGVGLFMVKRLVENAGGTITVESQPGVGSTFTVSLPA
ncbi:PAS domain-containing sensor histidine kinase [Hymenobacter psoromatis]|uniref:PAS domain-containing sensor histidine kinase n=1 Tax=Hymenobacter psoromatis TaxID=1484116 RepID=UPI001CBE0CB7|nr:PAS domain-containing sensor histidine kinase [Hymenobacter psoromatis]